MSGTVYESAYNGPQVDAVVLWGKNAITTGQISENAATATKLATARTIGGVSFDGSANIDLPGVNQAGNQNTSGNAATATTAAACSGNAATATKLATARTIGGVSFDGSANISLPGVNQAGNQDTSGNAATATTAAACSGNAATATKLATARAINGVNFDGSANITINAVDSTARIAVSEKGVASGVATLGLDGLIPTTQLPSYVDDVLEFANLASFPVTGETGKIYVAIDTNKTYRWSGSAYVYITSGAVDSVAGKTGVVVLAKADVGLSNVDNTSDANKAVLTATKLATARAINGVNFDGSAPITVTANTTNALTLGTGLSGTSFNGSSAVTAAVSYGSSSGTACQGNDARLHNAVTLNANATAGGLSLSTQEINFRAATNAQTGYATASHIAAIEANTAKVSNATHTGDVTGATALTIANKQTLTASNGVNISNTPTVIGASAPAISLTYGTGANTVCQGNDSRLSDTRTPTSHATNDSTYGYGDTTNAGHLRVGTGLTATTGTVSHTAHTGDVTGATALTIANDAVTFGKMQNIATSKLIGRTTASTGDPEEVPIVTTIGNPGADTNIPTEKAVRSAISAAGGGTVSSVASGNGMNFTTITGTGTVTMGTPSDISPSSTNSVSANSHTHAISGGTLCRAWVSYTTVTNTSARGSFNISSLTDNNTGDTTINFTNAMPDANYCVSFHSNNRTVEDDFFGNTGSPGIAYTRATDSIRIKTYGESAYRDAWWVDVAIFR